jgi:hypothetical protein
MAAMSAVAELDLNKQESGEGRRIVVVRRPNDAFHRNRYIIHLLMDQWRQWGFRVDVSDQTDPAAGPRTVVIPHLDATRTPAEYDASFARCALVLNRTVTDISKRRISENLVTKPSDHDGPVIVKTDRNAGGEPELQRVRDKGRFAQAALGLVGRLPWALTGMIGHYKVFDHPSAVPGTVWRNPLLVVEKFLPERREGMYCLRQYTFFGSREINTLALSADPIVKSGNVTQREVLSEPSPGVREIRTLLGFDYGKFDYVLRDGHIVLFDVNRTPTYDPASSAGSPSALIARLAAGIHGFFG